MNVIPETWPADFISRMGTWLGDEAPLFFQALAHRNIGLRLNSARGPIGDLVCRLPWATRPIPWCPEGVWLQDDAPVGSHIYHTMGVFYIQDPSAMAAGVLLDPQPGEWILDLAAAPGGKASHIAARMQNRGVLVTNEVVRRRTNVLAMNLERMGVRNALITNEYPEHLAERWPGLFDAVLLDAPCSGEGTFSRDSQAIRDWSLATVQGNSHRQLQILSQAALLVRPGGRLLYGTCTFAPEENEGVIAAFLAQSPEFRLCDLPQLPGLQAGHPEWIGAPDDLRRTGRFWPHTGPGHGHFYALLRRVGDPPNTLPDLWKDSRVPGRILSLYRKTLDGALTIAPPEAGLVLTREDDLYITPMMPGLWERLRVLRPGWWVASLRHNEINPDHALAMTLRPEDATMHIDLPMDDPRIMDYLRGGLWSDKAPAGFALITVDGFPLGWAKRGGGRLRSRYPIHLRPGQ